MASGLDELVFRATERLELLQLQVISGAHQAKQFVAKIQEFLVQTWNNPEMIEAWERLAETVRITSARAIESAQGAWRRVGIDDLPSLADVIRRLNALFADRMWRHTMFIFVSGVVCGSVFGITIGWHWRARVLAVPHCKALHSLKDGSAVMVEDAFGSDITHSTDVVVKIHSFSIQPLDRDILRGRGRNLRSMIRPRNMDVTLGRSFSGVITEMGTAVSQLEIGDEVWGALAEWEGGGAQEYITAPARRISRSPQALLPQAAASLPHCGSLALHYLNSTGLNEQMCTNKRVLIIGAGIGAGCVMLQLLKSWGAINTAVCDRRAQNLVSALGAQDVVIVDWCDDNGTNNGQDANLALCEAMVLDLAARDPWDVILICRAPKVIQMFMLKKLLCPLGVLADMRPRDLNTDRVGFILCTFYRSYLFLRRTISWLRGMYSDIDFLLPVAMDAEVLDVLANYVENGTLQTVVDKVYPLKDFELALAHSCGMNAIGCTIIRIS